MQTTDDNRPLAGVKVVEFGQFIAGPGATQILADLGADVIKIESPNGDNGRRFGVNAASKGRSGMFIAYNRGKRSIALDLRCAQGVAVARKLALGADVVVQNTRVGVMASIGLDAATLRQEKPALIYASISGFGTAGPSRQRPGLDIAAQAESGMMSLTGEAGGAPLKTGFAVVDAATATATANAILAALFRHARTGQGETIETSLLTVAIALQAQIWAEYGCSNQLPQRAGNAQPLVAPAADLIEVKDGYIVLSAYMEDHWKRLCEAIGQPELATDARFASSNQRVQHRPALMTILHDAFGSLAGEAVRAKLEAFGVVVGVVRDYAQVQASEDVRACGIFQSVADGLGGEVQVPGLPFSLADTIPGAQMARVPGLGEQGDEILRQAGYDDAQLQVLIDAGVVVRPASPRQTSAAREPAKPTAAQV
ncbi:acyl-CoA transferase [Marinobacterium aestuarii]|uniref:Acyl-CoA transferase n=1 Tax=Marinobacterium aestuarii TaxID=1821621 RepID=A0A1A9F0L9_9GAMM|nr:CoA transferase [Marinobacterium aestuarii]ANG63540.1 acyl-CoA transferase [Marinobacterium aestuarii]